MARIGFWIRNARPVALPQSLIPGIVAAALAAGEKDFSPVLAILAVLGVSLAHLSLNLFDDYFDYKKQESGYRNVLAREGIRARTVKCPYLVSGEATMKQLLATALVFGCLAVIPGVVIFLTRGLPILVLTVLTVGIGLSYSGGPLSMSFHGLGELVIGLLFGPFLMAGVYYGACGGFTLHILFLSVGMGMLVTNVLYTHSVLDYEADIRAGKRTLAALLKQNTPRYLVSCLLTILPYGIVAVLVAQSRLSVWYLLVFFTFPWAMELLISIKKHLNCPEVFQKPSGFWGPMEHWEQMEQGGLDWFMFRWYLARNILLGFGVLCVIGTIFDHVIK